MSADLKARIRSDLNQARKERDRHRTTVLSSTLSEIRNREIETGEEADDAEVISVLARAVKQREEAADQMREGDREELAEKEESEAEILTEYLPSPLSEDEVRSMVRDAIEEGADDIGSVMARVMPELKGRFEGSDASRIVREELQA